MICSAAQTVEASRQPSSLVQYFVVAALYCPRLCPSFLYIALVRFYLFTVG